MAPVPSKPDGAHQFACRHVATAPLLLSCATLRGGAFVEVDHNAPSYWPWKYPHPGESGEAFVRYDIESFFCRVAVRSARRQQQGRGPSPSPASAGGRCSISGCACSSYVPHEMCRPTASGRIRWIPANERTTRAAVDMAARVKFEFRDPEAATDLDGTLVIIAPRCSPPIRSAWCR